MDELLHARERYAEALVEWAIMSGENLLGEAQRLAPVKEGTLRGSGRLTLIVNTERFEGDNNKAAATARAVELARRGALRTVEAEVSFNTVYAARQHEELGWNHPKGGEAKYVEKPLKANAAKYRTGLELVLRKVG